MSAVSTLGRAALGSAVACGMTLGSLMLVAWMNNDPGLGEEEPARAQPKSVPVLPPPPEPTPTLSDDALPDAPTPSATAPTPSVAPPTPAPPQIAGLAPAAGPGTLRIGGGGSLPSMGTLPGSDLPAVADEGEETPARARTRPSPRYPALAQRKGLEGSVTVRLRVDENGRVTQAVVVKSDPPGVFDDAALGAARLYRFSPARRGGNAVASTLQQTIRFELQR
ncbi:MAG: TonB family protein [Myxococcota bacterium]